MTFLRSLFSSASFLFPLWQCQQFDGLGCFNTFSWPRCQNLLLSLKAKSGAIERFLWTSDFAPRSRLREALADVNEPVAFMSFMAFVLSHRYQHDLMWSLGDSLTHWGLCLQTHFCHLYSFCIVFTLADVHGEVVLQGIKSSKALPQAAPWELHLRHCLVENSWDADIRIIPPVRWCWSKKKIQG